MAGHSFRQLMFMPRLNLGPQAVFSTQYPLYKDLAHLLLYALEMGKGLQEQELTHQNSHQPFGIVAKNLFRHYCKLLFIGTCTYLIEAELNLRSTATQERQKPQE